MSVRLEGLVRRFGSTPAVHGVDLDVAQGELVALLGPSGAGKTTVMRIIAGLDNADEGRVLIAGADMAGVPARARNVGFVFQNYALFRHMTVAGNIAFGLKVRPAPRRPSRGDIAARVGELLALMQLPGIERRYPDQLSGGQRQRVALARALAIEPRVLLLDEPFGALDARVRKDLRRWLRSLHEKLHLTTIMVTHDQDEALELADRVAVLRAGKVEQIAAPSVLLEQPATPFVHGFLGQSEQLDVTVRAGVARPDGLPIEGWPCSLPDGRAVALVRPHDIGLVIDPAGGCRVRAVVPAGAMLRVEVEAGGRVLDVLGARGATYAAGARCQIDLGRATVYPAV